MPTFHQVLTAHLTLVSVGYLGTESPTFALASTFVTVIGLVLIHVCSRSRELELFLPGVH